MFFVLASINKVRKRPEYVFPIIMYLFFFTFLICKNGSLLKMEIESYNSKTLKSTVLKQKV
jgi:hypothetical protein